MNESDFVYDAWLASRLTSERGVFLVPGAQRPLNVANMSLAYTISKKCAFDLVSLICEDYTSNSPFILAQSFGWTPSSQGWPYDVLEYRAKRIPCLQRLLSSMNF